MNIISLLDKFAKNFFVNFKNSKIDIFGISSTFNISKIILELTFPLSYNSYLNILSKCSSKGKTILGHSHHSLPGDKGGSVKNSGSVAQWSELGI